MIFAESAATWSVVNYGSAGLCSSSPPAAVDALDAVLHCTPPTSAPSSGVADLYVYTGAVPGQLYIWPHFPASIQTDNHDGFGSLAWHVNGAAVTASGNYSYDECIPYCAAGPQVLDPVTLQLSNSRTCTVKLYDPQTGVGGTQEALVFTSSTLSWGSRGPPPYTPALSNPDC